MNVSNPNPEMHLLDLPLEIVIHILSTMGLREMRQFMHTNKQCRYICQKFLQRKFDFTLRPYIDHRDRFRAMMRHTRSIISGSTAVDFGLHSMTCPEFRSNDLDIYVGSTSALSVIQHLRYIEGYTAIPTTPRPPHLLLDNYDGGLSTVVRMAHTKKPKIDVVCSARISALHPLSFFWGTIPMTYLTANGFCTAYPDLFFEMKGCLNPVSGITDRAGECLAKYRRRGFEIGTFGINGVGGCRPLSREQRC